MSLRLSMLFLIYISSYIHLENRQNSLKRIIIKYNTIESPHQYRDAKLLKNMIFCIGINF